MDRLIALVLLRWRTDFRAMTWARERLVGIFLMLPGLLFFSVAGSLLVFFGFRAFDRGSSGTLPAVVSLAATLVGIFWALSPLLAGVALTESHDMSRLLHFPIPLPILVVSSLLANLAQPTVLAELPILLAGAVALGGLGPTLVPCLAGLLLSFGFILATAQATGLVLHGLSRSRRLHDLALFLGLALGFGLSLVPLLLLASGPRWLGLLATLIESDPLSLSPFGWGARAAVHAGRAQWAAFAGCAAGSLLATAAVMAASTVLIRRIHSGALDLGGAPSGPGASHARMLLPGGIGALVEKDLRVAWRDPALKASLFVGLLGPLLLLALFYGAGGGRPGSTLLILGSFIGLGGFGANVFGTERRGISLLFSFPTDRFRLLVAKSLAVLVFRLPGVLLLLVACLVLAPPAAPAVVVVTLATLLIASGTDCYLSILFPTAVPAPGRNPHGGPAAGGRGLGTALLVTLLIPVVLILSGPFAFLAWLPHLLRMPLLALASLPLAVAGAAATYALLVAGAARLLRRRETVVLERVLGEA